MEQKQNKAGSTKEKVLSSEDLFGEEKQVFIKHKESVYRLLITRQGKLILNK